MSESLKSNTTLTELNLGGEDKRQKTGIISINNSLFPFLITITENNIGYTGAASLSESLKSNTTLTELSLRCEDKRKKTLKDVHQQFTFFLSHHNTGNSIGERGAISLSESLKSNTTLTELNLSRNDKRHSKDIHH